MPIYSANTDRPYLADGRTGTNLPSARSKNSFSKNDKSQLSQFNQKFNAQNFSPDTPESYSGKVKQADLILFTTQLSVMINSGVVLSDALDAIAEQSQQGTFKSTISAVAEAVKNGENFSKALSSHPKAFNSMFISMVKAAETSGRMAEMLTVLSGYLNFESETRKKIKSALTYPAIMASVAVIAVGIMMFFVLPKFVKIYEAKEAALPKITQLLVAFSRIIGDSSKMTTISSTIIFLVFGLYFAAGTAAGRRFIDYLKIHTPIIGTMFIDMIITRSMRILATMIGTGVSIIDAIAVVHDACENKYFQEFWSSTNAKVHDGHQLSEAIRISPNSQLIAPGIVQMIRAGEKSGRLGDVTDKISLFYEKKLESSIRTVTSMIEPLMIVFLGGIIGTLAIALLLPIFRISTVVSH